DLYALKNRSGRPVAIAAGAASGQSTPAGTRFPIRLAVTVTDEKGNPVAGALIVFTAPRQGPGGRFAGGRRVVRVRTNGNGIAIAPSFAANLARGGDVVTAVVARAPPPRPVALLHTRAPRRP